MSGHNTGNSVGVSDKMQHGQYFSHRSPDRGESLCNFVRFVWTREIHGFSFALRIFKKIHFDCYKVWHYQKQSNRHIGIRNVTWMPRGSFFEKQHLVACTVTTITSLLLLRESQQCITGRNKKFSFPHVRFSSWKRYFSDHSQIPQNSVELFLEKQQGFSITCKQGANEKLYFHVNINYSVYL